MLKLIPHQSPTWTREALDHLVAHPDGYGMSVDAKLLAEVSELRGAIDGGVPPARGVPPRGRFYTIVDDQKLVGELFVTLVDQIPELSIGIYGECQGQGYAKRAMTMAIEHLATKGHPVVDACVSLRNQNKAPIQAVLLACGFQCRGQASGAEVWQRTAQGPEAESS